MVFKSDMKLTSNKTWYQWKDAMIEYFGMKKLLHLIIDVPEDESPEEETAIELSSKNNR
eukprot:Pgem_evm1s6306